jgi:enoyl-CoA hydratase
MYETLLLEERDQFLIVTINRPKALNALNTQVFTDLIDLFTKDLKAYQYRGIVITGAGKRAFVAGADIKEFLILDSTSAMKLSKRGQDIFMAIEQYQVPVIAAVNGFALGGGCELAMACHMRIAGANAKFGQPEVNLGIVPGYGGTQRLPQLIGKAKAMELTLTGDMIDAQEAYRLNLANVTCEAGEEVETALSLLEKIAKKAPLAVSEAITAVNAAFPTDGYQVEVEGFGRLAETADFKEGATAFIEKRKPNWLGK